MNEGGIPKVSGSMIPIINPDIHVNTVSEVLGLVAYGLRVGTRYDYHDVWFDSEVSLRAYLTDPRSNIYSYQPLGRARQLVL